MGSLVVMEIIDRKLAAPILECLEEKGVKCGELPGTSKVEVNSDADYEDAVRDLEEKLADCDREWKRALRIVPSTQT